MAKKLLAYFADKIAAGHKKNNVIMVEGRFRITNFRPLTRRSIKCPHLIDIKRFESAARFGIPKAALDALRYLRDEAGNILEEYKYNYNLVQSVVSRNLILDSGKSHLSYVLNQVSYNDGATGPSPNQIFTRFLIGEGSGTPTAGQTTLETEIGDQPFLVGYPIQTGAANEFLALFRNSLGHMGANGAHALTEAGIQRTGSTLLNRSTYTVVNVAQDDNVLGECTITYS